MTKNVDCSFLKINVDGLDLVLKNLVCQELRVFLYLTKFISGINLIYLTPDFKKRIIIELHISQPTLSRALKSLIDKKIIYPVDTPELKKFYERYTNDMFFSNIYFLNPNIVSNGSLDKINELKNILERIKDEQYK